MVEIYSGKELLIYSMLNMKNKTKDQMGPKEEWGQPLPTVLNIQESSVGRHPDWESPSQSSWETMVTTEGNILRKLCLIIVRTKIVRHRESMAHRGESHIGIVFAFNLVSAFRTFCVAGLSSSLSLSMITLNMSPFQHNHLKDWI